MTLRAIIFWIKDFINNRVVWNHYKQVLTTLNGKPNLKNENEALQKLIEYSTSNVNFYKKYKGVGFECFPIINNQIIKENEIEFLSPLFNKENLFVESTSGSTGTPFVVYQDTNKRKHSSADTIAFSEKAGFKFGSKLYYSRVWNHKNKKSAIQQVIQNIYMIDSDKLTDSDLQNFINLLENDKSNKSVLIFASTLTALYKYISKNNISVDAKISAFITMSESLPDATKAGIKKVFSCPVVARYSNCECGLIAQQDINNDYYILNSASFKVEILDIETNLIVKDGELGRIVVTDLYNYSMPLIRYDTGDLGLIEIKNGKRVLSRVDGRRVDCIYSTSGSLLSPYVINNSMWQYQDILQYQFVQNEEKDYTLKLNCVPGFNQEEEVLNVIKEYIGQDAKILIEYVDEIPLLSSGKRKQVINNYKK